MASKDLFGRRSEPGTGETLRSCGRTYTLLKGNSECVRRRNGEELKGSTGEEKSLLPLGMVNFMTGKPRWASRAQNFLTALC